LECGIPSHDTFSRVLRALDPQAFEQTFRTFMAAFAKANGIKLTGVIAVDGKALRGAYERGRSATPLHMVNVFAAEARMALASRKAPGRNEAKGALDVLCMLSLEGCIVTDALHCNRPFAETVLKRGGHYALALKQNQEAVYRFKSQPDRKCSCNLQIAIELQRSAGHVAPFRVAKIDFDVITDIAAKRKIDGKSRILHADVDAGSSEDQPHDSKFRAACRHA